jgi:transcriptional regulator with XRE-family HTH domain
LSRGFLKFSKLFLHYFAKSVAFSKLIWYNIEKGGDRMYKERVASCGKRISKALAIRDMRQSELCKLANVPKSSLSLYLSGAYEPKQDRIYAMAKALNVSEAWLMGYGVPMERVDSSSPEEPKLSEGEKMLLDLFRQVPEDQQQLVLGMIRAALNTKG